MKIKRNKKVKALNVVLIIVGILAVLFTVACMWFFFLFQTIPDTLVQMFFSTVVGELLCASLIRMTKTKYEREVDEDDIGDIDEDS